MRRILSAICLGVLAAWLPYTALAHGFGQRYTLPVPLWLYLYAAAIVVILSFLMIGLFMGEGEEDTGYRRLNLLRYAPFRTLMNPVFVAVLRGLAVAVLVLLVAAGLFGNQAPVLNIAPEFVWIYWWVGLPMFVALIGNIWPAINPWQAIFTWADDLAAALGARNGLDAGLTYPRTWGVWPAFLLYGGFIWTENVYVDRAVPFNLAVLILLYSFITWLGMALFGPATWLARGDPFGVLFGILGKFAPTEVRVVNPQVCEECDLACHQDGACINCYECFEMAAPEERELNLRPWAVGLTVADPPSPGRLAFVVLMLAGVTFDGIEATPLWSNLYLDVLPVIGESQIAAYLYGTAGLLTVWGGFMFIYSAISVVIAQMIGRRPIDVARVFIYSLVPIAFAYSVAHYYTLLLVQGQGMIALLSDPFGEGWNLFGTAGYGINVGIIGARFVWYSEVALIVGGHIIAVYLAHRIAVRTTRRRVLRSQYPMLGLMVLYTVTSLWIIAQPTTQEKASAMGRERGAMHRQMVQGFSQGHGEAALAPAAPKAGSLPGYRPI